MDAPQAVTRETLGWLATARLAADAAAKVHLRELGRVDMTHAVEKSGNDFVSRVDLESQAAALSVIRERHPGHGILAEEDDGSGQPSVHPTAPVWIVDPLDGTTNFLHGHPFFGASVGLWSEGRFTVGAVVAGMTGEAWWAADGMGAWYQGPTALEPIRLRTSGISSMADALVGTGFPFKARDLIPTHLGQADRVLRQSSGIRRCGSAALDLCYLAQGRLDCFWELVLSVWDVAAGLVILSEAGGVATRVDGSPIDLDAGDVLAANGPGLHEDLGRLVRADG